MKKRFTLKLLAASAALALCGAAAAQSSIKIANIVELSGGGATAGRGTGRLDLDDVVDVDCGAACAARCVVVHLTPCVPAARSIDATVPQRTLTVLRNLSKTGSH